MRSALRLAQRGTVASLYAEGATEGAPQAVQVADRWHLPCNLTSAVERTLEQRRSLLRSAMDRPSEPAAAAAADELPRKTRVQERKEQRRLRRLEFYNRVVELYRQGVSQQAISREWPGTEDRTAVPSGGPLSGTRHTAPQTASGECVPRLDRAALARRLSQCHSVVA
jgi:hypothetical protein